MKVLDLPNSNIKKLPIKLGRINVKTINLEDNMIDDENLQWLEEASIKKSLEVLNLAGNKVCIHCRQVRLHSSMMINCDV